MVSVVENVKLTIRVAMKYHSCSKVRFSGISLCLSSDTILSPSAKLLETVGVVLAPYIAINSETDLYEFATKQIDFREFLVKTCKSASQLTYTIVVFLRDLAALGKIPLNVVSHLWPF